MLPVRGRRDELAALDHHLGQLACGVGSVVVLEGPPGFGKSRMLREVVRRGQMLRLRSGVGMADPLDRVVDLAPVLEALFDGDEPLIDRSGLRDVHSAPEQRFWLLQDIESMLDKAAVEEPLLICLDDLQWADNGTAAALRTLPRRLSTLPIMWLLATRPGQGSQQIRSALGELVTQGAARLQLGPLGEGAVTRIVTDVLRGEPDEGLLDRARRTYGNPFLLVELLRGLADEDIVKVASGRAVLTEDRLPARVSDDMRQRLARLPESAERIAQSAASLGRRISVSDLANMTGTGALELMPTVQTLVDAALLTECGDRLAFVHDVVRDAVRSSVPAATRQALDRQGVDVLLARGALPVEVAAQLAASAQPGDRVAVTTLRDAAEALGTTDPTASAELAERALALSSIDDPLRGLLVAQRAISLFAAGLANEAKEFADTALREALRPDQQARVRLTIASMFSLSPDVRADNARQALELPGVSAEIRAWLESLVFHNLVVAGRTEPAAAMLDGVRANVDARGQREARYALQLAWGGLEYQQLGFEQALHHLDLAAQEGTSEDVRIRLADFFRCWPLAALDRFDDAQRCADQGITAAQRDRQHWALHIFEIWKGLQALQSGRLADAALLLDGRFQPAEAHRIVGIIDAAAVAGLGRLRLHLGDERGVRDVAGMAQVMLGSAPPATRAQAAWFLAQHELARGDAGEAHRRLCSLGEQERLSLFPLFPHDVADDPLLVRMALGAGDDELARTVEALASTRWQRNPSVASVQAAHAHVRGLIANETSELARAAELFAMSSRPLAEAQASEDLGHAHLEAGSTGQAIESFDRSLTAFAGAGARWDVARVRQQLRQLGVRRRLTRPEAAVTGWDALTAAEAAVAALVVEGRTNREIAQQLFVSPHTVNTHLRHVFDKMDVRSRVELARLPPGQ